MTDSYRNMIVAFLKLYLLFANFCGYDTSSAETVKQTSLRIEPERIFAALFRRRAQYSSGVGGLSWALHILGDCCGFQRSWGPCPVTLDQVPFLQEDCWFNKV